MPSRTKRPAQKVIDEALADLDDVPPENWPPDITYLTDHTYSDAVTAEQRTALSRPAPESDQWTKISREQINETLDRVKIIIIDDEKHPAYRQRGLFAKSKLDPDAFITLYLGHVHTNSLVDTDPHSDYDLALDRDIGLSVDAAKSGNIARFANDYRCVAERPNAEFRDCFIKVPCTKRAGGVKWERRVGIFVLPAGKAGKRKTGIRENEEVLVSYGKSYWESRKLMATFRKDFEMLNIAEAALDE
ncbi:hypothetical protein AMS68_000425 [Peltaster fructicola]|uniref:SET domain-containing protein n=1 Tax=Peltaster fructicola TaxID=286661 RepID=A0A6H0XJU9_9PEZI|nr:hypothetical protein AMS68_000425 [Peltaster fructicola]